MKIAALQLNIAWEDRQENYRRVEEFAIEAKENGADLLVLPEMFATGFSMNPDFTAEEEDGPTHSFLKRLAKKTGMAIIGGLVFAGENGKGRNTAVVINEEGIEISRYTKTHLFSFAKEDEFHEPGNDIVIFGMKGMNMACFICYDLRFPELFRRVTDGCGCVFVIASWPEARQLHWDTLLPARAVEDQLFLVGVNRTGKGGGLNYTGGSAIYGPAGEKLAFAGSKEKIIYSEINPEAVNETRKKMPFLQDIRF